MGEKDVPLQRPDWDGDGRAPELSLAEEEEELKYWQRVASPRKLAGVERQASIESFFAPRVDMEGAEAVEVPSSSLFGVELLRAPVALSLCRPPPPLTPGLPAAVPARSPSTPCRNSARGMRI